MNTINSGFAVTKLSASTPFSNGWRYLDGFWVDQFLKTAELQLDNEIFVFFKRKGSTNSGGGIGYVPSLGIIEECEGKRKRNAAEEKENNLPQTKMKPSEVISLPTIVNNILPNLTYLNLRNKSNSCTESTELRFPDEIVNWAGFEQGVLALQPELTATWCFSWFGNAKQWVLPNKDIIVLYEQEKEVKKDHMFVLIMLQYLVP
ncbi:hypothetical protein RhiirA5_495542 [Rhizophagus irregularis]|uniref:Uncharacterized protein n=1 Tax=Rhizophagus irregularis TaxID=588596 RepID=A0A2I1DX90_9GLOM|nr:hypothetical protein RhiirA5_495542 [Rhizophagus irregularis]PKY14488.1 hypothetical protein RhiirB3_426488 [Rhizophagus irregularis]